MTPHPARLIVADPSLVDPRGHHFSLTLQITRGAQALGIDTFWFTHQDFQVAETPPGVRICPVFSATMYDRYRPETKGRLPADLDRRLLEELRQGIRQADLRPHDHIYFHTGFGDLFRALATYVVEDDWRQMPYLHVCTPYDHDTMPAKDPGTALLDVLRSIRGWAAVDRKLFFWAETPQLAHHYTATYGFNMRAMQLPPPDGAQHAPGVTSGQTVTALYLGAARAEKGFTLLPELAQRLYDSHGRTGRLRFVIQCTPQIIGYLPNIRAAIDKLRALPAGYVELLDTVMSEADYHARMAQADVALLLYDRKSYRIRGSGIAVEAICADKCLLTHEGTFCASLLSHGGGAAVSDLLGAVDALGRLADDHGRFRALAAQQGAAYRERNSVTRYVARVMVAPRVHRPLPFLPSATIGRIAYPLLRPAG